jgi:uncharacterized protein
MRRITTNRVSVGLAAIVLSAATAFAGQRAPQIVDAAAQQDSDAVKAALKKGADVNAAGSDGSTALQWIAHWDDLQTADLLLKAGAKVNAANDHGVTPLALAAENVSLPMVELLLKKGADPNLAQTSGMTPLMTAAHTGSVPVVKALLAAKANVQAATTEMKSTALMWAVSDQFPDIAKLLIDAGADVHASTTNGFTPLLFAAQNGDIPMAKMLLAAGVQVNETGVDGTHGLPLAILRGQSAFALWLLDQGADANGQLGGIRALHAAASPVDLWLGEWRESHGAGNRRSTMRGFLTPAIRLELVKALLAHGADPNLRATSSGMLMSYIGYPKRGAYEPYACGTGDVKGATPLWAAANAVSGNQLQIMENSPRLPTAGYPAIIKALLDGGADQRIPTIDGTTPLMAAAGLGGGTFFPGAKRGLREENAEEAVKLFVEAGGDINAVNEADFTALHGATMRGLNEIIEYLVAHGANINARDFRGRTPYRIAEGAKQSFQFQAFPETAELLKRLGANPNLGIPGVVQERAAFYAYGEEATAATPLNTATVP